MQATIALNQNDYAKIRLASQTGKFSFNFTRNIETGKTTLTFNKIEIPKLLNTMQRVFPDVDIDFSEVMYVNKTTTLWDFIHADQISK